MKEFCVDESNAVQGTIDMQQPFGEQWKLDELLSLGKEFLQCTVASSWEDPQEAQMVLTNYMEVICKHRNQLDSKLDLQTEIGEFGSRFLYVLFHLKDYEECIHWYEIGICTQDALKESLESSGSVQFDVAISFLKQADINIDLKRLQYLMDRVSYHLERSCRLQVEDFDTFKTKLWFKVTTCETRPGLKDVTLGRLELVPAEMFEKLLGTPYSHFTHQQVVHILDEVLASAIDMKDKCWLAEAEVVLKMAKTFASKIEHEETKYGFLDSIEIELCRPSKFPHQNHKAANIEEAGLGEASESSSVKITDKNLNGGVKRGVRSHCGEDVIHSVDGENVDKSIKKMKGICMDENNTTEEMIDVQQPFGEQQKLDELLILCKESLQWTVAGSLEDLQDARMLLANYMGLICEHRNQLDSRLDLQREIGEFASRFLYVLFHLKDYEECIRWYETGICTPDALKESFEASGSVQYDVAISFLKHPDIMTIGLKRVQYLIDRGRYHLERSCQLQVEDFDTLKTKMQNTVTISVETGLVDVTLGCVQLVSTEKFEKLLGTPYGHFTYQQVVNVLDKALASAIDMKDKGWLVEAEVVLKMAKTFASKIEHEETKYGFLDSIETELCRPSKFSHQNHKAANIEEAGLREASESSSVKITDKNLNGGVKIGVASHCGKDVIHSVDGENVDKSIKKMKGIRMDESNTTEEMIDVQQPFGEQQKLDELLILCKESLQWTVAGSLEDLQDAKMLLANYMGLICEHRNQLDSRLDLQREIGEFASRFLYVLFHLKDYEECIRWYETGICTQDTLKESLEASGSVQYNIAISFLKRIVVNVDLQRLHTDQLIKDSTDRGMYHLRRSCQLQVEDFDSLAYNMKDEVYLIIGTDNIIGVKLGRLQLLPGEMFEKLLGTPYSHFTHQQVEHLLDEVLASTLYMKNKGWVVETEAVLKMGVTCVSKIEDDEMRNHFLDDFVAQLCQLYRFRGQYQKAAEVSEPSKFSERLSNFRDRQLRESERAWNWSQAGDHSQALEIITTTCSAIDVGDASGVPLPHEDWKLEAHLEFTYGRILERAGRADEAMKRMEGTKDLCSRFSYSGDDDRINEGLLWLLRLYGQVADCIESTLSLIDLIDPVMSKTECKSYFRKHWLFEKGLIFHRIYDQEEADKCLEDSASIRDESEYVSGNDDDSGNEDEPGDLYHKYLRLWCSQCNQKHLRDPMSHWRMFIYFAKLRWKFFETALEALHAAESVVHRRLNGEPSLLVDVHALRGCLFYDHQSHDETGDKAYEAYGRAVDILQDMNQDNYETKHRLSVCYKMQVSSKLIRGSLDAALDLIHKAAPVLEKENPGVYYYLQAMALQLQDKSEEAATFGERAFRELIKTQHFPPFQTHVVQGAWIGSFERSDLLNVLKFNEITSYHCKNLRDALIWAERSRMRLYMSNTEDQPSVVSSASELFDLHFQHAEELLGDAVLMCGAETAIILYSYDDVSNNLFSYLTFEGADRNIRIHCEPVHVPDYLKEWDRGTRLKTLEILVDRALDAIKNIDPSKKSKKDSMENHKRVSTERAKNLLGILHSILIETILVKPIEESRYDKPFVEFLRERCKNLVISPQGFLSKVPFGALYDDAQGEFLIEQKTVCVISSIRALHRSFQRQAEFEKGWKDLKPPFVAGNPDPMGKNLPQLKGAAQEAQNVAKILDGTQLFSGEKMTKAAVIQGLCSSQVVVLSTHGIINPYYPQGALVLRQKLDASPSRSLEETLTPADIVAMGTIPAGLVVLSACESGLGKVTQAEGLLGLGRAVQQSGAASTVLALWKVNDSATVDLITGMFVNLRKGWTVPQSLQASMVDMIYKGELIHEWAPFIAMGSPKLRLPKYSTNSFQFISTITPEPNEKPSSSIC